MRITEYRLMEVVEWALGQSMRDEPTEHEIADACDRGLLERGNVTLEATELGRAQFREYRERHWASVGKSER